MKKRVKEYIVKVNGNPCCLKFESLHKSGVLYPCEEGEKPISYNPSDYSEEYSRGHRKAKTAVNNAVKRTLGAIHKVSGEVGANGYRWPTAERFLKGVGNHELQIVPTYE